MSAAWDELTDEERAALLKAWAGPDGPVLDHPEDLLRIHFDGHRVDTLLRSVRPEIAADAVTMRAAVVETLSTIGRRFDLDERVARLGAAGVDDLVARARASRFGRGIHCDNQLDAQNVPSAPGRGDTRVVDGHVWTRCCGTWWSTTAWMAPGPGYGVLLGGRPACGECGYQLPGEKPTKVLAIEPHDADALEVEYVERTRDAERGEWLHSTDVTVAAGACANVLGNVVEPFSASHLAIVDDPNVLVAVRVDLQVARCLVLDHVPATLFGARVPADVRRPVDRGGRLPGGPRMFYPSCPPCLTVKNGTACPIRPQVAYLGRYPSMSEGDLALPGCRQS